MKNTMITLLTMIFMLSLYPQVLSCQVQTTKTNTVFLELFGNNLYYSINYEKMLIYNISPRVGVSIFPKGESSHTYGNNISIGISLLLMADYSIYLSPNHVLEVGAGYADIMDRERMYLTLTLGFKYIPKESKVFYKLSFTPLFNENIFHSKFQLWAGLSIGFNY